MDSLDDHEVLISLPLFKMLRIFNLCNPNSFKIFNYNASRLIVIMFMATTQCIHIYGLVYYFVSMDLVNNFTGFTLLVAIYIINLISSFKASIMIYNSEGIWDLLNVTRIRFLSSHQCAKYTLLLHQHRKYSITLINIICVFGLLILCLWVLSPLVINLIMIKSGVTNTLNMNIFNLSFPVSLHTYNEYFFLFYGIEIIAAIVTLYLLTLFNAIFISLAFSFIAQYHVLFESYKNVIHNQTSVQG